MGRLLRENERATKANLTQILNRFRAEVKEPVNRQGKSEYQIELEKLRKQDNDLIYRNMLVSLYRQLPEEQKREVFNSLAEEHRNDTINRAKTLLSNEISNNDQVTEDQVYNHVVQQIRTAQQNHNNQALLAAMRPYVRNADYQALVNDPSEMRVNNLIQEMGTRKDDVKKEFAYTISHANTLEEAKQIASAFVPQQKMNEFEFSGLNVTGLYLDMARNTLFPILSNHLSDETIDQFTREYDNFVPYSEQRFEDIGVHELEEPTENMKQLVDNDQTIRQEDKAQIKDMMSNLSNELYETSSNHLNDINSRRGNLEGALGRDATKEGEQTLIQMGINPEIIEPIFDEGVHTTYKVVAPGREQDMQRMRDMDMQFSDNTKNAIKQIFNKFEEYHLEPEGLQGEQGVKAYAFGKLNNNVVTYMEALQNQNVQESVRLIKEIDEQKTQFRDMLNIVHQNFPDGELDVHPGNVDVLRNPAMPLEFRTDIKGVSQLNGLFGIYSYIRANDLDVDEFLDHPLQTIKEDLEENFYKDSKTTELIKDKTGAEAVYALETDPIANAKYGNLSTPRVVESLYCLEKDPILKKHNLACGYSFSNATYSMYNDLSSSRTKEIEQNKDVVDRFLIVQEPQVDGKLLKGTAYNPITAKLETAKGFDEVEYIANNQETPSQFLARMKRNVVEYMHLNDIKNENDSTLSNTDFVMAAQKATAKYLMVNGLPDMRGRALQDLNEEEAASMDLLDFVQDGKGTVDNWIDNKYLHPVEQGAPILEVKAQRLKNSYQCTNPYSQMVAGFSERYRQRKEVRGDNRTYQQGERTRQSIKKKKNYLTQEFRNGRVPKSFYEARLEQLNNNQPNAPLPQFFVTDRIPSRDNYINQKYGAEANEFSDDEKTILYNNYIIAGREEKRTFLAKQYMLENHLVQPGQFFTIKEMEEMYPKARELEIQAEQERIQLEQEERQRIEEEEAHLPHDTRIKLVREGEALRGSTFSNQMNRFMKYAYREIPDRAENETELQYVRRNQEAKGDSLRGDAFVNKLLNQLTPEQKAHLGRFAPQQGQVELRRVIFLKLKNMLQNEEYYNKSLEATSLGPGPRKTQLEAEVQRVDNIVNQLKPNTLSLEDAKRLCAPLLTEQQLNSPQLKVENNLGKMFVVNNYDYVGKEVSHMLTAAQLQELNNTVDNYVVPWERDHEQLGEKEFTEQTETAKQRIDQLQTLDGQPLTEERKNQMKADLDAANDYLRRPRGEDPFSAYFALNTAYEKAVLHKNTEAGIAKMAEEGLDPNVIEERVNLDSGVINPVCVPGTEEGQQKWNEQEFKYSDATKASIKHVFNKMREYGYGRDGVVVEQGAAKEYGLSKLARKIDNYRAAVRQGDAVKMAKASKELMTEKEHVDEMLTYVREHFPCDHNNDNYSKPGNIDVVRNGNFPPELRYDDGVVAQFNGLFIMLSFAQANGIDPDEFLEHPTRYMKEYYLDNENQGINKALNGKVGGAALFEATKKIDNVPSFGLGSGRAFDAFTHLDMDPAIRAHNSALEQYLEKTVITNAENDKNRRRAAYGGNLDRFFFVDEPRENASLLGLQIYNSKTLSFDQPEPFNELEYLQNNGKSIAEMQRIFDRNLKEYLYLDAKNKNGAVSISTLSKESFLEVAQKAASKILIAKHAEKDDPAYRRLKGFLTDPQLYVNTLIVPEKAELREREHRLQTARDGLTEANRLINNRLTTLAQEQPNANQAEDAELQMLINIRNQRILEVNEHQDYLKENGPYDLVGSYYNDENRVYANKVESLEERIRDYSENPRPYGFNLQPDDDFNAEMTPLRQDLATIETRYRNRIRDVLIASGQDPNQPGFDAQIDEIANNELVGPLAVDDEIIVIKNMKANKLAEIEQKKADYIHQLGLDVEAGRVPLEFKDARTQQLLDPHYDYTTLPAVFPKAPAMTKQDYLNSIAVNVDLAPYTDEDREELYQVYLRQLDEPRQKRIEEVAIQKNAQQLGFVTTRVEEPQAQPQPQVQVQAEQQAQPQPQVEQPHDFSGKWFEPGTQITKAAYIQKLKDTEAHADLMDEHPVGNNWQERRQSIEEAKKERARMEFFFRESWEKLSPEGKQNVYNALGAEGKHGIDYDIKTDYASILNRAEKSNESKAMAANIRANRQTLTLEQVKQMAEPFMTEAERNDPRLVHINRLSYNQHIAEKGQHNVWEAVVNSLPEEEFKNIAYRTDAYKPILDRSDEEVTVKVFVDEMNAAKGVIGAMNYYHGQPLTEERKNQINANIDQAGALFANLDPSYVSELENARIGREQGDFGMSVFRKEQAVEEFADNGIQVGDTFGQGNLKFTGAIKVPPYYIDQFNEKRNLDQINPDMLDQYNAMRNMKVQLRDETKQSVKAIFEKFDEFGYDQHEFAPEEGTKVYGFHGIAYAYNDLTDKLSSNDPVEKMKVGDASERLIGEYNKSKELMQMISDAGLDKGYYSSNLDIVRTQGLPIEFRKNIAGASALNGLYLIYHSLKQQNISYDDFLADPRAVLDRQTKAAIDKLDPNKAVRGKSAGEALFELSLPTESKPERLLNSLLTRASENITKIETDPNMAKHNAAVDQSFVMTNNYELATMSHRDFVFSGGEPYFDRLLMMKEPLEDVSVLEVPTYNYDTMQVMPSREFDDMEYLMATNEDANSYIRRIVKEGGKAIALAQADPNSRLRPEMAGTAIQKAALKYIVAHPEMDRNSIQFRTLNNIVAHPKETLRGLFTQMNQNGGVTYNGQNYQINVEDAVEDLQQNLVERSYTDFVNSRAVKNFGSQTRAADEQANRNFKNLQTAVVRAQNTFDRANNDVARAQAQQQLTEARNALNAAIAQRKTQLMQDFKAGRISEEYLDRRNAQLDAKRFNDRVPSMFEADRLMSKNEYINSKFADSRDELSNDEKTILYNRYIERCKSKKNAFLGNLYLKDQGITTKLVKDEHNQYVDDRKILTQAEKQQLAQRIDNIKQGVIPAQGGVQHQQVVQNQQPQQVVQEQPVVQQPQINVAPQPQVQINNQQPNINENINIINDNNINIINPRPNLEEQIKNNNGHINIDLDAEIAREKIINIDNQFKSEAGKIEIDLDDIDIDQLNNIADEKENINKIAEDKKIEEEKILDDGEQIYINIDDEEDVKINDDILNVGKDKELNKDDLKK